MTSNVVSKNSRLISRTEPPRPLVALIPLMPNDDAEQRANGPEESSDEPTDPFAEPLHRLLSKYAHCARRAEVAEERREGSLSWL